MEGLVQIWFCLMAVMPGIIFIRSRLVPAEGVVDRLTRRMDKVKETHMTLKFFYEGGYVCAMA